MKTAWIALLSLGLTLTSAIAWAKPNVILITIDGVRSEEMFNKKGLIPRLRSRVRNGQAFAFSKLKIANSAGISLPGYMSILSGQPERKCKTNVCGNTTHETFFDGLIDHFGFDPATLATIASWKTIHQAIEHHPGRIYRDIGPQAEDENDLPPWRRSRWDHRTFEHALNYLEEKKPRALYVSFVETDEYAHQRKYDQYVNAIQLFDERLELLIQKLESMGNYGDETSIVITTDHGRGHGWLYFMHAFSFTGAGRAWAFVIPSPKYLRDRQFTKSQSQKYSHTQIRPTLESLLGLRPLTGTPLLN